MLEKLRNYYKERTKSPLLQVWEFQIEEGFRIISCYESGDVISFYIIDHFANELILRLSYKNHGLEYIIKWYTSDVVNNIIFDERPAFLKLKHIIDSYIR